MKSLQRWWLISLCACPLGCVDDTNTIASNQPFPATYLRGALGCQRSDAEFLGVAQRFLGCSDPANESPMDGIGVAAVTDEAVATSAGDPGNPAAPGMPAGAPASAGPIGGGGAPPLAGSGGAGAGPDPRSVACGARTCPAPPAGGQACCVDPVSGSCGVLTETMCAAPGAPAASAPCPIVDLTRLGYGMLQPCCTADRQCGVNTQQFPGGMPCTSLADSKRTAENMGYRDLVPDPRACPP